MIGGILHTSEEKMKTSVEVLKKELLGIRTGRASPALVEHLKVDYAGVPTPLNQMASITAPQARLLMIQPWDPGTMSNIEKTILKSDLGLTPINDGRVIRLNIPPLSEERRQELIKVVHRRVEEKKIAIRNVRRDALEDLKKAEKNKEVSQDEYKRAEVQLQKLTDTCIASTDQVGRNKEAELAEV